MTTVKINEQTLDKHAEKIESSMESMEYLPMKDGNMAYSQSNSMDNYRDALLNFLEAVEAFQGIVKSDSKRISKIGKAMVATDKNAAQKISKGMN
ncbi:DUF3130 family protein [Listeria seeligeri]|uniref:DUF3130 family protein n=1 Tax=Listeria seeligeri TaxID=1640 RepID=UPI001BDA699D|nr:DUF3130 family protein [Listeria seeligeri]MBT0177037.1 DUF3130 family protein [Listeria seeligeri]